MNIRFRTPGRFGDDAPAGPIRAGFHGNGELVMKWETPQAIDLRFGMEITMYIAHR
ncbi:MAG TPA: pyrroloquinoline quinone precursor peptide PqqA [Steroidobacteraceae bacterium]|nr:pyrroloquinoline quinone precursor peptide PqqA [Steroidobacteraceae bacterium]